MFPTADDWMLILYAILFEGCVIGIPFILKKAGKIKGFTARKIIHLFSGFTVFIVPFLSVPMFALVVSLPFLIILRLSRPQTPMFELMGDKDERKIGYLSGPFFYALSINILVFIFCLDGLIGYFYFPASSIMIMAISDTVAAYVGRRFGKHPIKLEYTGTVRTVEGSLGMFISAFLVALFGFSFFGLWFPGNSHTLEVFSVIIISLLIAATSTVIEIISPSNLDDLTVPIAGCMVSFVIAKVFFL